MEGVLPKQAGLVYFIQAVGGGPIKIGYTRDEKTLANRLSVMQTGHWRRLQVTSVIRDADRTAERLLHRVFAPARLRGEWFLACDELARGADAEPDPEIPEELAALVTVNFEKYFRALVPEPA